MSNEPHLLDDLIDVLTTIIYTSCVKDHVPISIILIADSGTAKSKIIKSFNGSGIHQTDSFSSQGLFQLMQTDPENKIRYILVPDLNPTLSRQPKTVNSTVANLLTLTMDGTCRIDDGRAEKIVKHKPIGIISAVTPEIYRQQTKKWLALGLTRRILPVFYEYKLETVKALLEIVANGCITSGDFPLQKVSFCEPCDPPKINQTHAKVLEVLAITLSAHLGMQKFKDKDSGQFRYVLKKIIPIAPTVVLRTIAQAHAIRRSSDLVQDEDISFLGKFLEFTNPQQVRQI